MAMPQEADWVSVLRTLMQQMSTANATDLELRRGDLRVRLRREPLACEPPAPSDSASPAVHERDTLHRVLAPLTGIFYAAANPNSKPFVAEGDWVEPDAVVGLIETMKVFNEVTADTRGRVAVLLAKQGQLIHAGEPVLLVDLNAAPDQGGEVKD